MSRMRQTSDTTTKKARKMPMSKYSVGCCGKGGKENTNLSNNLHIMLVERVIAEVSLP